jgi:broad specificity phosphatase PhoE
VEIDERWLETDVGLAEGLTFDDVAARFPMLAEALLADAVDIDWPRGETAAALRRRIAGAWAAVIETGPARRSSCRTRARSAWRRRSRRARLMQRSPSSKPAAWTELEILDGLVAPAG